MIDLFGHPYDFHHRDPVGHLGPFHGRLVAHHQALFPWGLNFVKMPLSPSRFALQTALDRLALVEGLGIGWPSSRSSFGLLVERSKGDGPPAMQRNILVSLLRRQNEAAFGKASFELPTDVRRAHIRQPVGR